MVVDALAPGIDLKPFFDLMAQRAACSRSFTPRARTSKSSGIAPTSFRIRSSTPRSPPWCWAMAIRSPTISSCSASPATRSTSPRASPTGRAGRCRKAQVDYAISDVTHLRDVYRKLQGDLDKRGRTDWLSRGDGRPHLARHLPDGAGRCLAAAEARACASRRSLRC